MREAVIQTILHVARNFPIIRFDAAMTLAKKHIQRLWFPEPGAGGAIPSRAEHGMTRAEFDAAMPEEFWREVVDRVAAEVPDTLLLAEAFWLMEGYFVRTLGMHRVYNSAFMHMLRDEDNAKYRMAIKNTLEFDPQILKRYVNFMSNPDEKTAIEQFGNGGQIFRRVRPCCPRCPVCRCSVTDRWRASAKNMGWSTASQVGRDTRRGLSSVTTSGTSSRSFTADTCSPMWRISSSMTCSLRWQRGRERLRLLEYSRLQIGDERGLVIYHNRFADTRGWIRISAAYLENGGLRQKSLAEGLGLPGDGYVIFRDGITGMEYIRSCRELAEKGMYVELGAYKCHTFLDFRFVDGGQWAEINHSLNGAGVQSMQAMFDERFGAKEEVVEEKKRRQRKRRKFLPGSAQL